ncbi:hypothetical protein BT63DRAFT_466630 [Microthyrium microscopicum]|uniref:Protein HRI1 n=1 Tax=Microthyrium microscopicum TaxID=703497 RepID=A0A6A6UPP0_9PEZI|nr:hypothetical protein BT63DRAFT_466630 [Microthyrium microscopicum]
MSVRLTQRRSFRWLPEPASETTDTLVMSVGSWFIDLRIKLDTGALEWGFAGEEKILNISESHVTYQWTHDIDSQGYTEPDIGSLPVDPVGDFLETGTAPHPETGIVTKFEEAWRALSIPFSTEFPYAWILQSEDGRTFIGKAGGIFQAMRSGTKGPGGMYGFCARREVWKGVEMKWIIKQETGHNSALGELKTLARNLGQEEFAWEGSSTEGELVNVFGDLYIVRALVHVKPN